MISDIIGRREVIIGSNSIIWKQLSNHDLLSGTSVEAISHREVESYDFLKSDRVWVLSYSREHQENLDLLNMIKNSSVNEVVYVTSASTNVLEVCDCYEYPKAKAKAHEAARLICNARILAIGLFYVDECDLPAGTTAATSAKMFAEFIQSPDWNTTDTIQLLFKPITRPFNSVFEKLMYTSYGKMQSLCGSMPCILRPLDLVLRSLNMRWYGYLYLSNKLWFTTI